MAVREGLKGKVEETATEGGNRRREERNLTKGKT